MSSKNKSLQSSMLGESVSVRNVRNKTVVDSRRKQRQSREGVDRSKLEAARAKFQAAAMYAKAQIKLKESRDLYRTGLTDKKRTAFVVAMSDFLNSPEASIGSLHSYRGRVGDPIAVNAIDDFMVTKVDIEILDASGATIEEGAAVNTPGKPSEWVYTATVANPNLSGSKIRATAYDTPGNTGTAEVVL